MSDPSEAPTGTDDGSSSGDDGAGGSDGSADDVADDERARIRREKQAEMLAGGTPVEPVAIEGNAHFEAVLDEDVVLVTFHEEWHGPCEIVRPTVGAVAEVMPVTVATVDVSDHPAISVKYDVEVLPTFLVVADGEEVERLTGVRDEMELGRAVDDYV